MSIFCRRGCAYTLQGCSSGGAGFLHPAGLGRDVNEVGHKAPLLLVVGCRFPSVMSERKEQFCPQTGLKFGIRSEVQGIVSFTHP